MHYSQHGGALLASILVFVYTLYMWYYLNDAEKCDKYLKKQDRDFRQAAKWITLASLILSGISLAWNGMMFFSGAWSAGRAYYGRGGYGGYSNMGGGVDMM